MARSAKLEVRMTPLEKGRLVEHAERLRLTASELVRIVVWRFAEENQGLLDAEADPVPDLDEMFKGGSQTMLHEASKTLGATRQVRPYRCPDSRCDYSAHSPAAICPTHGRRCLRA